MRRIWSQSFEEGTHANPLVLVPCVQFEVISDSIFWRFAGVIQAVDYSYPGYK
jgi:hypothetical protein